MLESLEAQGHPLCFPQVCWLALSRPPGNMSARLRRGSIGERVRALLSLLLLGSLAHRATSINVPLDVNALAHHGEATISWVAPTAAPDTVIWYYQVAALPGGEVVAVTQDASTVTALVSPLTNGVEYAFRVMSVFNDTAGGHSGNVSSASAASNSVTPRGACLCLRVQPLPRTNLHLRRVRRCCAHSSARASIRDRRHFSRGRCDAERCAASPRAPHLPVTRRSSRGHHSVAECHVVFSD